ncbi:MAG TPA: monofunctional biosynthetic peptidoglycan transglycosylase [Bacteroidota bacterium]
MEQVEAEQVSSPNFFQKLFQVLKRNKWKTALGVLVLFLGIEFATLPLGEIQRLRTDNPDETAFMQFATDAAEREGKPLRIHQTWVSLRRIPQHTINAVIVAEDGTFWSHGGFDWFEFRESLRRNLTEWRFARGASTITQQLVKNLYLSPSKDPMRKLKEWILTWKIESALSKSRIIEIYLNVIEWGEGIYGVEAAAQHYFGKSASDLTREESARLAAVIPNPKRYHATSESRAVLSRVSTILTRMEARGW